MIEVAVRRTVPGIFGRYRTVATIRVEDDGTYTTTSDDDGTAAGILTIPVMHQDQDGTPTRLSVDDDPETWARLLHTAMRSGYYYTETIADSRQEPAKPAADQLAAQLRSARGQQRISQAQLATSLDVDPSYISQLEAGGSNPTLAQLDRIAAALDAPVRLSIAAGK